MDKISIDLERSIIKPEILLSGVKLIDESSRIAPEFQDKKYLPFYYHLGKYIEPISVVQIGPKLGLPAVCFLQSCKSVKSWTIIGNPDRFVKSNINLMSVPVDFKKSVHDLYDLALLSEKWDKKDIELLWQSLKSERLLIVDYINENQQGSMFFEFCEIMHVEPTVLKTRHGIGIIQKR